MCIYYFIIVKKTPEYIKYLDIFIIIFCYELLIYFVQMSSRRDL